MQFLIFCFLFYLEKRENQTNTIERLFTHQQLAHDYTRTNNNRKKIHERQYQISSTNKY